MNNENYISEEVFEELVNGLEFIESFTLYGRKGLKYHIKRLQEENQQLKERLQQKEDIINKAKEIIDKFYISNNFVVYDNNDITKAIIKLEEILDNKGE